MDLERSLQTSTYISEHFKSIYENLMLSQFESQHTKEEVYRVVKNLAKRIDKGIVRLGDISNNMTIAVNCYKEIQKLNVTLLIKQE